MSNTSSADPKPPVTPPKGADPRWQEKIEKSLKAREFSKQIRRGKAASFRRAVGRAG